MYKKYILLYIYIKYMNNLNNRKLRDERINKIRNMYNKYSFNKKMFILGFGAIGKPILFMILKLININPNNITVIHKEKLTFEKEEFINKGVKFINSNITDKNYKLILDTVNKGDIIIDCAYDISTIDILNFCESRNCNFINSCINDWDYDIIDDPIKYSMKYKNDKIIELNNTMLNKKFNAIISMGCNPGNVSIWVKLGLEKINKKYNYKYKSYAELARMLGVQVIHISERDTQKSSLPKKTGEYCNTWSTDGECFIEESLGCVEASWGTHETKIPENTLVLDNNYILINKMGIFTKAQSIIPIYGRYIGNIVRHDESHTIGKALEIIENNQIIYKPSVYYVYHPCDSAKISIDEVIEKDLYYQDKYRLLTNEIISGRDILGLTFFLENKEVYWIGSLLTIDEAREIFEYKFNKYINATNVQVMIGYLSGIIHIIDLLKDNKYNGIMIPDDLPHEKIFKISKPFLGDFIFKQINDFKLIKYTHKFTDQHMYTNEWKFENFIIS